MSFVLSQLFIFYHILVVFIPLTLLHILDWSIHKGRTVQVVQKRKFIFHLIISTIILFCIFKRNVEMH